MLVNLSIENVVLIDHLTLDLKQGLCALTGETGAGKSILLDSISLAIGMRASAGLVRKGKNQARVTAMFQPPQNHPSESLLKEAGIDTEDTLILRRILSADGRSRAFINDQPATIGLLKKIGETLVEIHGQFETQALLDPSVHLNILDEYAGLEKTLHEFWSAYNTATQELKALKESVKNSKIDEEYLRQSIEDLNVLSPQMGEEQHLSTLKETLKHRDLVISTLNEAFQTLSAEDDPITKTWAALEKIADILGEQGQPLLQSLERANLETQEALSFIRDLSMRYDEAEHGLEDIDDRLFALRAAARKHGCTVGDLPQMQEELQESLNKIDHADTLLSDKENAVKNARNAYQTAAEKTSTMRKKAAIKLDKLVNAELPALKMERAKFKTDIKPKEEKDWNADGIDSIRFLVATNPGAAPGPLNKIASGGEMARFMLALKVITGEIGAPQSIIFDEADTGVGGAVADAIGERLAKLGQSKQVMVVTHAPQVAARANNHYIVEKTGKVKPTTKITPLKSREARAEEIARMLAGAIITPEARAAANKLLEPTKAA